MDYYDENGNKVDKEEVNYLERLSSSKTEKENEIIKYFINVELIYQLLQNKGLKPSSSQIKMVNKEFQNVDFEYTKMLSIWNNYQLNPFDRFSFKIEHKKKKYYPHVDIYPKNLKQIKLYLDFTSEWINTMLLSIKEKSFEIHSEFNYLKDFDKLIVLTEEKINNEIERVENHINYLVNGLNLNSSLIDYINHFENLTIDIDFFKIKRIDRIENIWSIAIGIGVLLGDYKYLSRLNRKKRDYTATNTYIIKDNHSYYSEFSDLELKKIYNKLVEYEYIEQMNNSTDFIKIFRESKLTEIKPIVWKKVQSRWLCILTLIELLVKPDYSDESLYRYILGRCFEFGNGKEIKDDIGKSIKEPLKKVSKNNKLDEKIKKIVSLD